MKKKVNRGAKHQKYAKLLNSKEWQELRMWKIRECGGLCERCKKEGYITAAKIVHHIVPVESVEEERMAEVCFNKNNLMLLCRDCHHKVHEEMHSHKGQLIGKLPTEELTEEQRRLKQWVESHGGTYRAPAKKGVRLTPLGWLTTDEFKQKLDERQKAWVEKYRPKDHDTTDTKGETGVDACTKD